MCKALYIFAAAVAVAFPAVASAENLAPTSSELEWARSRAGAYWHVQDLPCGRETVLTETPLPEGDAGLAITGSCTFAFSPAMDWRDFPGPTCLTYIHEFGHLLLGPTYFAAVNPTEPDHSPDTTNVMYGKTLSPEQAVTLQRSVGCLSTPRHHRRRARRSRR